LAQVLLDPQAQTHAHETRRIARWCRLLH